MLEPRRPRDPRSDAALELGLLSSGSDGLSRRRGCSPRVAPGWPAADRETLFRAGRAAHALALPHDADAYFKAAAARGVDPARRDGLRAMFLDIYYAADALKAFQAAWRPIRVGAGATPAWRARWRTRIRPAAAEAADKALAIDPTLADAHLTLAQMDLDSARGTTRRANGSTRCSPINERDLDARSLLAAIAYVRTGREAFDSEAKRVLAVNPELRRGVPRRRPISPRRNYRFDEAVALSRRPSRSTDRTRARTPISACS